MAKFGIRVREVWFEVTSSVIRIVGGKVVSPVRIRRRIEAVARSTRISRKLEVPTRIRARIMASARATRISRKLEVPTRIRARIEGVSR